MKIDFKFDVKDQVKIIDAKDITGRIIAFARANEGNYYKIIYWHHGERYEEWLYEWELEATC